MVNGRYFGLDVEEVGGNFRLSEIQASIAREQLKKVPMQIIRRQEIAMKYNTAFKDLVGVAVPTYPLDVEPSWKCLLLMCIGVFAQHACDDYVAIMKELAINQKLYLIIASTDYIYGTNYQFCHGYIGKDLESLSQEKFIQAIGRVGRSDLKQDYSIRLRSDTSISKLFSKSTTTIEIDNINRLFV